MSVERNQEIRSAFLIRDARRFSKKVSDWLTYPTNFRNVCFAAVVVGIFLPMLIPLLTMLSFMATFWWRLRKIRLPLRYPAWIRSPDPSTLDDKATKIKNGEGIEFIGNERRGTTIRGGDELWTSDSDIRVHRLVMATTGGGKTNTLLSWMLNPLCWGSGFMYSDGKAQNTLWVDIYAMADLMWRVDDLLIVNYMMGGEDPFEELALGRKTKKSRKSNTMNPFGKANPDTINQLLSTLMPKASGDAQTWQSKAVNMMTGVTQVSCYLRAKRESMVSVKTLRDNMSLQSIIKLSQRTDLPESAIGAVKAYLNVGLPGFNPENVKAGKPQSQTTLDQHGYLTGQYTRTLGLLSDTYGHIFMDTLPEVDMMDVVLNNRILVVMIPTLEMSVEQAGNLGKIVVASTKMMMAASLGANVEGTVNDLTKNRATNSRVPYEVVLDELGYYFADGIDLMFAQGRSLMLGLTASGQDFQAMAKDNKNQVESMIANTGLKCALKTEDPKETFEVFQKAGGEAYVARTAGFENNTGTGILGTQNTSKTDSSIEKQSRISLEELRALAPGDGVLLFKEKVVRAEMFNMYTDLPRRDDMDVRVNVMLPIDMPQLHEIAASCQRSDEDQTSKIMSLLMSGAMPRYTMHNDDNEVLVAVASAATKIPATTSPVERGISLFVAARRALHRKKGLINEEDIPTDEMLQERVLAKKNAEALSFLNEPPFEPVKQAKPAGDEEFGHEQAQKIELTSATKSEIAEMIDTLTPGNASPEAIESGTEAIRSAVESGCEFSEGEGAGTPPAALNSVTDLLGAFEDMQKIYS